METGPEQSMLSKYLTKAELAAQLHRSIHSVDRWAVTGNGPPCVRIGRRTGFAEIHTNGIEGIEGGLLLETIRTHREDTKDTPEGFQNSLEQERSPRGEYLQ